MDYKRLNPAVRSAVIYEKIDRSEECIAYDARLMYVISGDVSVTTGGKRAVHLTSGRILYIPAGTPYRLKGQYLRMAVIAFDLYDTDADSECPTPAPSAEFKPELLRTFEDTKPFDKVILLEDMRADEDTLIEMCNSTISAEGTYLAALSARLKLILLRIAEATDENALPARMVEALGEYIRENVGDEISNTEIGAIFGYHPFYVSKVLKNAKGQTLRQYIISYRLKLAQRMLTATARSIAEIAESCGFTDASYFTKTFRSAFGETPKDYRNRFKKDFI